MNKDELEQKRIDMWEWTFDSILSEKNNKYDAQDVAEFKILAFDKMFKPKIQINEAEEFIKCKYDIRYFAETYCATKVWDSGLQNPVKLKPIQYQILHDIVNSGNSGDKLYFNRQVGSSLITRIYLAHYLTFNKNVNVAVVGRSMSTTVELKTLSDLLNSLPDFLQHKTTTQNKHHIALSNGSQVRVTTGSSQFFQGQTHNLIIMDNYRYNDDTTDFINQIIKPIMSCRSDSQIINIQSG